MLNLNKSLPNTVICACLASRTPKREHVTGFNRVELVLSGIRNGL